MTEELKEALRGAASSATSHVSAAEVWQLGRRRRRRATALSAFAVGVVLAVGGLGLHSLRELAAEIPPTTSTPWTGERGRSGSQRSRSPSRGSGFG